jgi:PAS domain S-box-containing protein
MSDTRPNPTGRVIRFADEDIIVSKTDLKGRITYANGVFVRVSGYSEAELLGAPHSILRHPAMPRCVFKLLWDTIAARREIFAYVLNLAKNGDEYWVFAHVTPSYNLKGEHVGYHSNRRAPHADALAQVAPLYAALLAEERKHTDRATGMRESTALVLNLLAKHGVDYGQFVFGLSKHTALQTEAA